MNENKIYPFNNSIETGLRMLIVLTSAYPSKYDIDHLVYFDYMVVHSGDIDPQVKSLHPAVPNRSGEIFVRRSLIQDGIDVFIQKGLISKYYNESGIQYGATEISTPFLEALNEGYTENLIERANWVMEKYAFFELKKLHKLMNYNLSKIRNEFNLEIIK